MSASRVVRRVVAGAFAACAVTVVAPASLHPASASTDRLRVTFDSDASAGAVLLAGAPVTDVSGQGNNGTVSTAFAGSVVAVAGPFGIAADFPGKCSSEPCPNALVDIPEDQSLDPMTADFEWGARILMQPSETDDGENVLQKGLYDEPGGQWKLQVDKAGGFPSCVISGKVPGQSLVRRVVLIASVSVANGVWHQVTCRRTSAAGVQIVIDGVVRGAASMPVVMLDSVAHVSIGSKWVTPSDNDQFHGVLDDVFMTVLDGTPVPNTPPVAAFTSSCVDLVCGFDASTSTDNGPVTYAWNFGDGANGAGVAPSHAYSGVGAHVVTLTVTDGPGLTGTVTHTVSTAQNTPPVAAFTSSCIDLVCAFDASTSTDNGPVTYAWNFGDGATGTGVAPSHAFAAVGNHPVTLTVTDGPGLTSVVTQAVSIAENVPPVAAFTSSCTGLVCAFDASTSTDNGPLTYAWTFGDAGTATGIIASHTYTASAQYPVVLTVTDAFGSATSIGHQVTVTQPTTAVTYVGRTTVSASSTSHVANVPTAVRAGDAMLLFFSAGTNATVNQPTGVTGWIQVDSLTGTNGSTRVWRKVATATDAGRQVKITLSATSKGNLTIVAYRGTSTTNPVAGFARQLSTTSTTTRTTPITNVATPSIVVSYWMQRDSSSTTFTAPAGVTVRATGTQSGGAHVTMLMADSGTAAAPAGPYGGLTARANASSNFATTWTIVLAPA